MKNLKFIFVLVIALLLVKDVNSQFMEFANDVFSQNQYGSSANYFMGNLKPERTDLSGGDSTTWEARFPILIVFVQFANETEEDTYNWPIGGPPTYINQLLSYNRKDNSNWWQAYDPSTESISSYYHEISRGKMHVVGKCINIILDSSAQYYRTRYSDTAESKINYDVYEKLKADTSIHWLDFDLWKKGNDGLFYFQKDGYVDMLFMVHRRTWENGPLYHYEGYTPLGNTYNNGIYNSIYIVHESDVDTVKINGNYNSQGSGCKILGKFSVVDKKNLMGVSSHEHGHYLFGSGHITYAKMCYGYGLDFSLSPWEIIKLGYSGKVDVNTSISNNYNLNDFSARDTTNKVILQVPISSTANSEFFLIANRGKVSDWDRIMLGDTAHDNPLRNINSEYGKGVYIYHVINGYGYPSWYNSSDIDQECADGLWNWSYYGSAHPDWNNVDLVSVYTKSSVSYQNDQTSGGTNAKDGKSILSWFGLGKLHTYQGGDGMDRVYTTDENFWTSREWKGDRWDAWKPGYNEVFSPYSSPNTFSWGNDTTGIFIYFDSLNGNTANIKIYRATEFGGETDLADILEATPPSRPMGLTISTSDCINDRLYPVLTWNHNMEPDMIQGKMEGKRYKIFKAYEQYGTVPNNYIEIADLLINKDEQPTYMDTFVWNSCWDGNHTEYSIRYKIIAIDKTNWSSVYSDFVSFSSLDLKGDNMGSLVNNNTVKKYELSQNFPNPFNPVTKINYALPKQGFVTLKIYDITGREIQTLVNEVKQAGYYTVDFNGSHLSSGVYFYKIKSSHFVSVKRMVLIK